MDIAWKTEQKFKLLRPLAAHPHAYAITQRKCKEPKAGNAVAEITYYRQKEIEKIYSVHRMYEDGLR